MEKEKIIYLLQNIKCNNEQYGYLTNDILKDIDNTILELQKEDRKKLKRRYYRKINYHCDPRP